ncbi:Sm-like protein LSM7 [Fusarium oxysporum f. sp. albedinis]|nr:Sm-like protein LSM7 [Fusarium oxysporum f. sp. albedinis]
MSTSFSTVIQRNRSSDIVHMLFALNSSSHRMRHFLWSVSRNYPISMPCHYLWFEYRIVSVSCSSLHLIMKVRTP